MGTKNIAINVANHRCKMQKKRRDLTFLQHKLHFAKAFVETCKIDLFSINCAKKWVVLHLQHNMHVKESSGLG